MAEIKLPFDKGLRTSKSQLALVPGELWRAEGCYFKPDNADSLAKMPGRSSSGTVGSGSIAPIGLLGLHYHEATSVLLSARDDGSHSIKFYEAAVASGVLGWNTSNLTSNGSPYTAAGSFLKGVPDGLNRWFVFSGDENERPAIRSSAGYWRRAGLQKPSGKPLLSPVTTAPASDRVFAASGSVWTDLTKAYDADSTTFSFASISSTSTSKIQRWNHTGGGTSSSQQLSVRFGTSGMPPLGDGGGGGGGNYGGGNPGAGSGGTEPITITFLVEYTTDAGSHWTTLSSSTNPVSTQTVTVALADSLTLDNIGVRATGTYVSGTGSVSCRIYDIVISASGSGSPALIEPGTYGYVVSTVYIGADGVAVESEGCDPVYLTVAKPNSSVYSIQLNFSSFGDGNTSAATNITPGTGTGYLYRIYRTTATGVYPNLGWIQDITPTASTWVDPFDVSGTTLSAVPYPTVAVAGLQYPRNGTPPPFYDATFYNGAIVAIPANDRFRIKWSMPGSPESWPTTVQDLLLPGSDKNDELCGITVNADNLLLFSRTQVYRLDGLPFAGQLNFDPTTATRELIAPNIGLAAGPKGYCGAHDQTGRPVTLWISDNGIYQTFGKFIYMMGPIVLKLTDALDWAGTVDQSRLAESSLIYDPQREIVIFEFWHVNGTRCQYFLHMGHLHWYQFEKTQKMLPQITGPHQVSNGTHHLLHSAILDLSDQYERWSLDNLGATFHEFTGLRDDGYFFNSLGDIETMIQTGWNYFAGSRGFTHVYTGALAHTHWLPVSTVDLLGEFRDDDSGNIQLVVKSGVSLKGARVTRLWLSRAGQSIRFTLKQIGQAIGSFSSFSIDAEAKPGSDAV